MVLNGSPLHVVPACNQSRRQLQKRKCVCATRGLIGPGPCSTQAKRCFSEGPREMHRLGAPRGLCTYRRAAKGPLLTALSTRQKSHSLGLCCNQRW